MAYSGLYFIPTPGSSADASSKILTQIVDSIESRFELSSRQNPWTLSHRLLRSVPPTASTNAAQTQALQYHHILRLSYLSQSKTYCYIHPIQTSLAVKQQPAPTPPPKTEPTSNAPTPQPPHASTSPPATSTIITIPASQTESHTLFLVNQLSPLWTFRHALSVAQGLTYTIGQLTIYIGELHASRAGPTQSNQPISPGVVVCMSTATGSAIEDEEDVDMRDSGYTSFNDSQEDESADLSGAEEVIRGCWRTISLGLDFGKTEVREVMMGKEGEEGKSEGGKDRGEEAIVSMWCDVLKLRG